MLFAAGFRYRVHDPKLPGKPDIVLKRHMTAVFVNGCFWHGHTCARGKRPESNAEFWNTKIDANVRRDRRNRLTLKKAGWRYVVIWQCRLSADTAKLIKQLETIRLTAVGRRQNS